MCSGGGNYERRPFEQPSEVADMVWWGIVLIVLAAVALVVGTGIRSVPPDMVGVVVKRFGPRRQDDDPLMSRPGSAGPQAAILPPDTVWWRPSVLFLVRYFPMVRVPSGTIGLVVARAGAVLPPGQSMARHVDCDHFRDGTRFLSEGGEQGRQLAVLTGGLYAINPALFDVITVLTTHAMEQVGLTADDLREVEIPVGMTGVVITHLGVIPADATMPGERVAGHESFQRPWVFLEAGGELGVQRETLAEGGRYAINPWFARVVLVPIRELIFEWSRATKSADSFDFGLDQIVIDVQGHVIRFDMLQTLQIPVAAAPGLVKRFGVGNDPALPIQRFAAQVLGTTVDAHFRRVSASFTFRDFIRDYDYIRLDLAAEIQASLASLGIVARTTTLLEFTADEPEFNMIRRQIAVQRERVELAAARLQELEAQRANARVRVDIEQQQAKVDEERRELEAIEAKVLMELLGTNEVVLERALSQAADIQVPYRVAEGSLNAVLQALPLTRIREMLASAVPAKRPDPAPVELDAAYRQNINGQAHIVLTLSGDGDPAAAILRAVPVSIYLASDVDAEAVEAAVLDLLDEAGIDITESKPAIVGSWLGLRLGRFRRHVTATEAGEVTARVERALQARLLDQPQADIDAKQAEAVARLIGALDKQSDACIQVGSLFLIKVGQRLVVRNLTPREMAFLGRNQTVLKDPEQVLDALEKMANPPANGQVPDLPGAQRPTLTDAPDPNAPQ
ncbi:SPFH domain-containing protein [Actinocrispum wychmicini]|uniref:Regulator of protease activity HflC (Stomatin/prohibitin superfamily) n=1 Tax=Actinocrispum wychmicini TaxID=1213861 RepID=A0A4R2JBZ8_9PSEU|nr:SPFH domain-containing protein [Actinocrispum wychmicini]TCO53619.1 regulator of protease activity HflC (stomatin/prohibitin superfamily) [Actinocrispum wychmicini]